MKPVEVYRDDLCYVTIQDEPATLGHVKIHPHSQAPSLESMKEEHVVHLFHVASVCASILFEGLQAQGTNIICNNGDGPVYVEVLARSEGDNLGYNWEPKQGNPAEISQIADQIASKIVPVEPPLEKPIVQESPEEIPQEEDAVNLKIEQLRRIP